MRAQKASPADTPKVIEHGTPVPDPIHPGILFAALLPAAADNPASTRGPGQDEALHGHSAVSLEAYFSPQIFFRPPPFRS
ncbi:MAG: hypothetical protein WBE72_04080 [Terracidiphilus sp.]